MRATAWRRSRRYVECEGLADWVPADFITARKRDTINKASREVPNDPLRETYEASTLRDHLATKSAFANLGEELTDLVAQVGITNGTARAPRRSELYARTPPRSNRD